jgi:predicted  nucleic acid-binding Zn-ribbon protein
MLKKISLPLLLILGIACSGPSKKQLSEEKENLLLEAAQKDKDLNELVNALNAIDENLQQIKEKEKIITLNMNSPEAGSESVQEKINNDIQDIYNLMLANKQYISNLETKLKQSGTENKNLNSLVSRLNKELKEKSFEIITLKDQLTAKNIEITSLNFTIEGMSSVIDSMRMASEQTQASLDSTTTELNAAYYAFGTKKELKEHKVISSEGLPLIGKTKVLSEDFDVDYFTKVDIREIETIPLFRSKVKVLTNHPDGSYEIIEAEENTKTIKILDKSAFWSISKFLVVQTN